MDVPEIDVEELARRHADGAVVIDVRNPDEYEAYHVPGAVLVPLPDLPDRVAELPADTTLHMVCGSGGRSRRAAEYLIERGFDAVNVAGGSKGWLAAGHDVATGAGADQ